STAQGVLVGTWRAIERAWLPSGADLTSTLSQGGDAGVKFRAGDTLLVSLGAPPAGRVRGGVMVEAASAEASGGILVEGLGQDPTRGWILPRAGFSAGGVATGA